MVELERTGTELWHREGVKDKRIWSVASGVRACFLHRSMEQVVLTNHFSDNLSVIII